MTDIGSEPLKRRTIEDIKLRPEDTRLSDGRTIITALLPDEPTITKEKHQEASDALQIAITENSALVSSLEGKTAEEAREALQPYLDRVRNGGLDQAA